MAGKDITKFFDGIEKLTGTLNWKIWIYRVTKALEAADAVKFVTANHNAADADDRTLHQAVYNSITELIPDKIISHYINETETKTLLGELKK